MPPFPATAPAQDTAPDHALAVRAAAGEAGAFAAIMRRHNQRLYRLVRSILKDEAEAEDALQESYLRAYAALGAFRSDSGLYTWLAKIAINEALGRLRRRRPQVESLDAMSEAAADRVSNVVALAGHEPLPDGAAAQAEMRRLIERAIDTLPPDFRTVFVLRAVEQASVEDVAQLLQVPEATVKTRLHRAKRLLRLALSDAVTTSLPDAFSFLGSRCDRVIARVLHRLPAGPPAPP